MVKILKFFDAGPGSGMEKSRIRIRDKHPGSATLYIGLLNLIPHLDGSLEAWDVVKHSHVLVPSCEHVLPAILEEQARDGLRVHVVYLALALACGF
jgi:hypothetical protein